MPQYLNRTHDRVAQISLLLSAYALLKAACHSSVKVLVVTQTSQTRGHNFPNPIMLVHAGPLALCEALRTLLSADTADVNQRKRSKRRPNTKCKTMHVAGWGSLPNYALPEAN